MITAHERRVVITGAGLISPLGLEPESLFSALLSERSGVGRLNGLSDEALPAGYGGCAREFQGDIDDFGPLEKSQKKNIRKGIKVMCRDTCMGVAAAQRALADAGLTSGHYDPQRAGVVFGADYMMTRPEEFSDGIRACFSEVKQFVFGGWGDTGLPKVTPLWLLKYLPNMPASHIAIYNDLQGPSNSITLREASSNLSIAEAYGTILRGRADLMVAGASGSKVQPMRTVHAATQEQLATHGVDPAEMSRPFDLDRTGMVIGEGSGAVILEELQNAESRGAKIYGEIIGCGSSSVVAHGCVGQTGKALQNAIQMALRSSGITPDQVGHVHAHGLSTRAGDAEESRALQSIFADRSSSVPVVAIKSNFGNLGAGSGSVELIASLIALREKTLPPVRNYRTADPECNIAVVRPGTSISSGTSVLNLNVTPQGQASSLLVRS